MLTSKNRLIARNIAVVLLAGVWKPMAMSDRLLTWLGPRTRRSQRTLVVEILKAHKGAYPPSVRETARLVAGLPSFRRVVGDSLGPSMAPRLLPHSLTDAIIVCGNECDLQIDLSPLPHSRFCLQSKKSDGVWGTRPPKGCGRADAGGRPKRYDNLARSRQRRDSGQSAAAPSKLRNGSR
jgi:hypothetical protein